MFDRTAARPRQQITLGFITGIVEPFFENCIAPCWMLRTQSLAHTVCAQRGAVGPTVLVCVNITWIFLVCLFHTLKYLSLFFHTSPGPQQQPTRALSYWLTRFRWLICNLPLRKISFRPLYARFKPVSWLLSKPATIALADGRASALVDQQAHINW